MCTCASIKPGTIQRPTASTTSLPGGRAARASGVAGPIDRIRPSRTTRRTLPCGGAPVPSTSVAPRSTRVAASSVFKSGLRRDRGLFLPLRLLDLDRIDAREAGGARRLLRPPEAFEHSLGRQIAQAVG